jgi:hypothetical protein
MSPIIVLLGQVEINELELGRLGYIEIGLAADRAKGDSGISGLACDWFYFNPKHGWCLFESVSFLTCTVNVIEWMWSNKRTLTSRTFALRSCHVVRFGPIPRIR